MTYLAIVSVTPEGRVAKFAEFPAEPAARAHALRHGGFVARNPGAPWTHWMCDPAAGTVTIDPPAPVVKRKSDRTIAFERLAVAAGVDLSDLSL